VSTVVCQRAGCQQQFPQTRLRRKFCSRECHTEAQRAVNRARHYGAKCQMPGCEASITKAARYCRHHYSQDQRAYGSGNCAICGRQFQLGSGNQKYCSADCRRTLADAGRRQLGRACTCGAPILDDNVSAMCSMCRASHAREKVATLHETAHAFAKPILQWMLDEDLTFGEAGEQLGLAEPRLRGLAGVQSLSRSVHRKTVLDVAERLGNIGARGWDTDEWARTLMPVRLQGARVQAWAAWAVAWVCEASDDPFATALAAAIGSVPMTYGEVGIIAKIDTTAVLGWLRTNERQPIRRPNLNRLGGAAAILAWPETDGVTIESKMLEVFQLIADGEMLRPNVRRRINWEEWRDCSPAGCLILRRLWELGHDVKWLRNVSGADLNTLYRYIRTGRVGEETCIRVTNCLQLSAAECERLGKMTHAPRKSDFVRMVATQKRNRRIKKAQPLAVAIATDKRRGRAFTRYEEAWDSLLRQGRTPSVNALVVEYGFKWASVKRWRAGVT